MALFLVPYIVHVQITTGSYVPVIMLYKIHNHQSLYYFAYCFLAFPLVISSAIMVLIEEVAELNALRRHGTGSIL